MVKDHQQGQLNGQVYNWLVSYMDKVQVMLGSYGIAYYTGPYNRVQVPNYPYILNTIPQVRMRLVNDHDLMVCDDMLVRYMGGLKRKIEDDEKLLKTYCMATTRHTLLHRSTRSITLLVRYHQQFFAR
jgi:hypothetical protein